MEIGEKLEKFLPGYARLPLLCVLCMAGFTYFATRLVTRQLPHHIMALPIDDAIPFVPSFVVIYVLAYVQWAVGWVLIGREGRAFCYRVFSGEILSKCICVVLFILLPTTMVRAADTGDSWFGTAVGWLYAIDAPDNLFPSIHCLDSWLCFRSAMQSKRLPAWYRYGSLGFTLLVFASTLLIKQHVAVDVLGGVLACEAGQALSARLHTGTIFERLETRVKGKRG